MSLSRPITQEYSESLLVHFRYGEQLKQKATGCSGIDLNHRQLCDLELLLNRAFYPLSGYLAREDYESVLDTMRLCDGTPWPMPVCLDIDEKIARELSAGQHLALNDQEGFLLAILTVGDIWQPDKKREALKIYGTDDASSHPGVQQLYSNVKDWYVSGTLEGLNLPIHYDFKELRRTPADTHRMFALNGWRNVIGFHTREYLHCAHREMVLRAAREAGANIFLQPVVSLGQYGNLDHYTHVRCYQQIAQKFPKNMVLVGLLPLADRWAGPREALWQAIIKRNYGCSHFLVADDHADPFSAISNGGHQLFYPRHAAQELVGEFAKETGIEMVPANKMVYVEEKAQYLPESEVAEGMRINEISSAELKRRLEHDLEIPEWFSYPEVVEELKRTYPPRSRQGFTIFITGFSGSGKSTLARVLLIKFLEMRTRPVTLLDGDIVRKNLSSELNFSKEHRNLNITRIGFVASEITKNGGIAICAPIAPYEESRKANRELISSCGGYIEVYMATPLEVCEQRDRKGVYAKARAGKVKAFTGVTDPYIPPANPELTIDTSNMTPAEAAQEVLLYLEEQGYLR
ncbi:bifunctional sulfate adenylyltransferase/adenylylsulfate kinase [Desulfopila aestuarii]|uniref:adenylyl-sulfate kinase n=1 Tax=Desulfopila aestuarii DSM 18488 TaxID=1121416 RepID=A0A1M7YLN6_9BACT|nr:bifunctional sulfate adenylyltransferase/adenylylsulfate kinase [Desulfopila aestuarii]SHO53540.1 sulfate adenylyltransferase [Desulfopila aestuarii DSM 18488]